MFGHAQGELLAQLRPSTTVAQALYSVNDVAIEATLLLACVRPSASGTIQVIVYHDDDGTTYDDDSVIIVENKTISTTSLLFQAQHPGSGLFVKPGGSIGIKVDTANEVNFLLYGISADIAGQGIR